MDPTGESQTARSRIPELTKLCSTGEAKKSPDGELIISKIISSPGIFISQLFEDKISKIEFEKSKLDFRFFISEL